MQGEPTDINSFLPKFYPKQQQISLKINPILQNIRQTKVVSYHQFKHNNFSPEKLETPSQNYQPSVKIRHFKHFLTIENKKSIFDNNQKDINFIKTQYEQNFTSQKNRKQAYSTLQITENQKRAFQNRNDSLKRRSKTSDKKAYKQQSSLVPGTAQLRRKVGPIDIQRLNLLIKNPEGQIDLDEDFSNYIRLKILTKNPYFSAGKSSKIKKHLVEDINLQQIQKKFFKSSDLNTKYKQFFQQIMQKNKNNSSPVPKFHRTMYNTSALRNNQESTFLQKQNQSKQKFIPEFNSSKYSQQVEREECPFSIRGVSTQRSKKMSFKARILFRKSRLEAHQHVSFYKEQHSTMEVTGNNKITNLNNTCELEIRNKLDHEINANKKSIFS